MKYITEDGIEFSEYTKAREHEEEWKRKNFTLEFKEEIDVKSLKDFFEACIEDYNQYGYVKDFKDYAYEVLMNAFFDNEMQKRLRNFLQLDD